MKVMVFGATGMIGQGVLRECLLDARVERVTAVGRSAPAQQHEKLVALRHDDLHDYSAIRAQLQGLDACFFCLGVSSAGMSEAAYTQVTYDLTLAAAKALVAESPQLTFCFVSGAGTDSSEQGSSMWARVKGRTENALLALPFKAAYMFRPGLIRPMHGITSRTAAYRVVYALLWPFMPLLTAAGLGTSTQALGRAMIGVADKGWGHRILNNRDINAAAARG